MDSHSLILVLIIFAITVDVTSAQVTLESFRLCIGDQGLSPDLIVHHSTGNSSLYEELDYRWNVRPVNLHPLAYFVPRVTSDVQVGVRCARANNIPVIPKSGGHSAELLGFGNAGTIVISFHHMKKIQINVSEATAIIEAGALLGEIREKLLNEGGFGLSSGICDEVGIAGIALGGGDGNTTPVHNLTIDNILEMEMVDSNGDLHLVNENVNSDLFWALRGIGPGYIGIVTSFKFKLFNATDLRTTRLTLSWDSENVGSLLLAFQDWLVWIDEEGFDVRTTFNVIGSDGRCNLNIYLLEEISNGPTNVQRALDKANEIFPPLVGQEVTLSFPSYAELGNDEENNELIAINANVPTFVKKKSFFVSRTFSAEELEKVVEMLRRTRNLRLRILFYAFTGRFNKMTDTDMSYVHRGHLYLVSPRVDTDSGVSDEEAQLALDWLNKFETESKIIDSGASYQNYVDLDLDNFMERYYGVNSQLLMEIKRKWDPDNYFQSQQSIPLANMAAKSLIILPTSFLCLCLLIVIKNY